MSPLTMSQSRPILAVAVHGDGGLLADLDGYRDGNHVGQDIAQWHHKARLRGGGRERNLRLTEGLLLLDAIGLFFCQSRTHYTRSAQLPLFCVSLFPFIPTGHFARFHLHAFRHSHSNKH